MNHDRRSLLLVTTVVNLVCFLAVTPPARGLDTSGTDFWLAFQENIDASGSLEVLITSEVATAGNLEIPGLGFSQDFSVGAGAMERLSVPIGAMVTSEDGIEDLGVHVTAVAPVVVYGANRNPLSTDTFVALPTALLDLSYIVRGFTPTIASQLAVVGTVDNTTVTITPSVQIGAHPPGVPFQLTLEAGEVHQLQSPSTDVTGTLVSSDAPVAVFAGNQCAQIPVGTQFCDHLVGQMLPESSWGQHFFIANLATRLGGDLVRLLASQNNTFITLNGSGNPGVPVLNRGEFFDFTATSDTEITADQPISVAQFAHSQMFDSVDSDPFMMEALSSSLYSTRYRISTLDDGSLFAVNYVNVIAPDAAVGSIALDGNAIPSGEFSPIGAPPTGFSAARVSLPPGTHLLEGPLAFGAGVYGFAANVSYGHPAGGSPAPPEEIFSDGFESGDTSAWSSTVP